MAGERDRPAPLTFRAGREGDAATIAEMTRDIWDGQDYLPRVWNDWVNDPRGILHVGLLDDRIVTTGRVVELTPGRWWLEGLRVHPDFQGQGYATLIHRHMVEVALKQPSIRTLGLTTDWANEKVAHLARATGFRRVGRYRLLKGEPLPDPAPGVEQVREASLPALMERLSASRWLAVTGGYLMDGWVARHLDETWLSEIVASGGLWRCGEALALTGGGSHQRRTWLYLVEGGGPEEQEALVRQARHLALFKEPDSHLRCFVPLDPGLFEVLHSAGMGNPSNGDDDGFYLYHFMRIVEAGDTRI